MSEDKCGGCGCIGYHSLGCPYVSATAWKVQNDLAYKKLEAQLAAQTDLLRRVENIVIKLKAVIEAMKQYQGAKDYGSKRMMEDAYLNLIKAEAEAQLSELDMFK